MHTEGNEVHESTDEARAGSTPNVVRWVLGISLLAAIVLLSAIWMFGAASTDEADREANVTDRVENASDDGASTDSIVSEQLASDPDAASEAVTQPTAGPTASHSPQ